MVGGSCETVGGGLGGEDDGIGVGGRGDAGGGG